MSEASKSHRADCPDAASRPLLIETTAFALYFFVWKLCMAATLARAPRLAEVGVLGSTYARLLAFTGLGYVLFWVAHSYLPTQKYRKIAVAFVLALCLVGSIGMMATRRIESLLLASCATVLALGYIGAGIHYDFSLASHGSEFFGRALGIGMGASSLLQYAVEVMVWTPVVFVVCVVLSLSAITWLVTRPANSRRLEQDPSAKQAPTVGGRSVVILVIAAVAMTFNYGLLDSVLVWKYASGEIISVGLSKIVYILSLPLAGVLFDLKKGNLRSLITVCVMFLIAVATPAAETDGWLGMATVMAGGLRRLLRHVSQRELHEDRARYVAPGGHRERGQSRQLLCGSHWSVDCAPPLRVVWHGGDGGRVVSVVDWLPSGPSSRHCLGCREGPRKG